MSAPRPQRPLDPAIVAAREREDIVVGNEIVRHDRARLLVDPVLLGRVELLSAVLQELVQGRVQLGIALETVAARRR